MEEGLNKQVLKELEKKLAFVKSIKNLRYEGDVLNGEVIFNFPKLKNDLTFKFEILPHYPFKTYHTETIRFYNKSLIAYDHVMEDGHICFHNRHSVNLKEKLVLDFNSLKEWIENFYIKKSSNQNYEHLVVNKSIVEDSYYAFHFTQIEYSFSKDEYGLVDLTQAGIGYYNEIKLQNFLVQNFKNNSDVIAECNWSFNIKDLPNSNIGLYYFLENSPSTYNKFIFDNWLDFTNILSVEFLNFLNEFENRNLKKYRDSKIPIFFGYKIDENECFWQVAILKIGSFPTEGVPERKNDKKTGIWNSQLIDSKINWCFTKDCSYKYFFGRGKLSNLITEKKILIIGVGAIGSIVATTLTRGGAKNIDFIDYDIKEPENICRSEYSFRQGINTKTVELADNLTSISPFLNINNLQNKYFEDITKRFINDEEYKLGLTNNLNAYDIIFDCSTDDDLMYILDNLKIKGSLINLSISNFAKELICGIYPNTYRFVRNQFDNILTVDDDLYEPIGYWSPTFKASYNDVNLLVQYALKHINQKIEENKLRNFVIEEDRYKNILRINEY
ncbi:ThiF family adenylyltransferase [Mesonia mobilis]|uniref:THIF-type NAD/FAD binding fold domain-containing protein n=1 Tax=Mesonia mobilis TaxID=369791 RepID=A0ABQ3BTT1_9FLAO|nr:ThiF family adenylyltransferase [Mesonia mobilis]MBQ0738541.1 ThiF family adenylyltransferase [Aquimarina celericrescens]GGZ56497.1 hypothetical protein GCM10008088_17590 [Mesonia mobilis]